MKEKKTGNGSGRRLKALFKKEFYQIIRDPSSILISFVLPCLLLFFYGYGISLDINHLKIGLVLEDTSPDAISFADSLKNSPYFDVTLSRNRKELEEEVVKGTLKGMVVVPSYFTAFRERGDTAPIQVIADGSEPNTASFVQNYVEGALRTWLQIQAQSRNWNQIPLIGIQTRFWYNEQLESHYFLVPGSLAIIMTLIGTLLTSLVVAREWERGTMEELMSTPVHISELVIGKLIPYFILGMLSLIFSFFLARLLYGVPFRGSFIVLCIVSAIFLIAALALGLLLSTLSKNQFVASQAAMVSAFLPSFILSGFIFEITTMPLWIQLITYILPARYFVASLQTLFLVGNVWGLLLFNSFLMLILGLVILLITARRTKKRLET